MTVPARGALIWLNVFIASISRTGLPGSDSLANRDERRRTRLGGQVDDADHGARHGAGRGRGLVGMNGGRGGRGDVGRGRSGRHGGGRGMSNGGRGADQAQTALAVLHLHLRQAALLQHGGQPLDGLGIELDAAHGTAFMAIGPICRPAARRSPAEPARSPGSQGPRSRQWRPSRYTSAAGIPRGGGCW